MDEDLAEAIDEEFYNSYKTWKDDHFQDTVNQKVIVNLCLYNFDDIEKNHEIQVRHFARSLENHLGVRATPRTIVDAIQKKKLSQGNYLKDKIEEEFGLV